MNRRLLATLLFGLGLAGCSAGTMHWDGGPEGSRDGAGDGGTCTVAGRMSCLGNVLQTCDSSGTLTSTDCGSQVCVANVGCRTCIPGAHVCGSDGTPGTCSTDGSSFTPGTPCPSGTHCQDGACADLCGMAAMTHSYIGCDYWPVTLLNSQLGSLPADPMNPNGPAVGVDGFPFAIAVANPQMTPATISISGAGISTPQSVSVAAGSLQIIQLPWQQDISQVTQSGTMYGGPGTSVLAPGGAYHVTSDVPITVYQFNALSYRDVNRTSCDPSNPADENCFSYSNDSSLLLPTSVLTGNYTAVSYPALTFTDNITMQYSASGGFITIVGTQANTTVTVHLTGGVRAGPGVNATAAGGTITQTLNAGDVLELVSDGSDASDCMMDPTPIVTQMSRGQTFNEYVCQPNHNHDLTGSVISASSPVVVYGGHDCSFVPYNRFACDHLEQELFPNETLGTHYFASHTQPQLSGGEPNELRITSNHDGNMITFSPTSVHGAVMLDRGQYVDFEQHDDVEINGSGPFIVTQFLVGQNYFGNNVMLPPTTVGDPSMSLEVAVEQWRSSYEFLAPNTYPVSYVNVVAQHGSTILLDGSPLTSTPSTTNGFDVYRENISSRTGAHSIQSADGSHFSIKVYGFGSYTSYMYPGGLDLTQISPPG